MCATYVCTPLSQAPRARCRQLDGKVKLGAVNCDEENALCGRHGVKGFPTVKWFGSKKQRPQDYGGSRDAQGLVDFGLKQWTKSAPAPEVCARLLPLHWLSRHARSVCCSCVISVPSLSDSVAAGTVGTPVLRNF
jgi:Thioredoxin